MKYIHVRHMDYWWAIYNIGNYKQDYANSLEFCITNDEKGENIYFHLDLYNLTCLEQILAGGLYEEASGADCDLFRKRYSELKSGKMDFFIGNLFYCENGQHGEGYSFLSLNGCQLNSCSIFEVKNRNHKVPDYGVIFISETEALIPQKVVCWIERLSKELFLETFKVQFINAPDENEALISYCASPR